ncbi:MAG: alpha-isopropylmalate synthase regulatory domain-containing protein, partial [Pseudomonadota bacterium]|nr:alpha-isopropylmalate synthase regulatory domain-containing protein [Pseudomonadota bacterium]
GKHSGRHAFRAKLEDLGYKLGDNALNDAFNRFKDLADQKKEIFDDDIIALMDDQNRMDKTQDIQFETLIVHAGTDGPQTSEITLNVAGESKTAKASGNGPVDAMFKAIRDIYPHDETELLLYNVHAVTGGIDAQAEVTVRLQEHGHIVNGKGADVDTMIASAKAYVHALNKLAHIRAVSLQNGGAAPIYEVGP